MTSVEGSTKAIIDPQDTLLVIGAAIFTSLLTEGISWFLIYRHPEYKNLTMNIESLQKKIERMKESKIYTGTLSKSKTADRKLQSHESQLKDYNAELQKSRMTSTFFVALFMMIFMSLLSSAYQGIVVAKLPFEPFSMIQGITHRNLMGDDYTDCSMIFIYILSNISLRPIIQKLLGFAGPRSLQPETPSFFQQ